ncbi:hypothetical protein H6F42_10985 [Pseudanabaena sp. FACHB-1998]|uniref:hypothetical protein n=1 Tax=Pseudanabaena sp. FACHB-1998 TaxID=2692858 RepID=UPI00168000B4|nr:hypothetical protein [Pseudanabaena sp. FACHB-1998]MBD2177436.1 hypothetical protein [Pseudanabaena sp. FACHB-1998]
MVKNPKQAREVFSTKDPRIASDPNSYYQKRPSWRVAKMEFVDPFGWHTLDANGVNEIRKKLASFETMTWREILLDAKKQNHNISVEDLAKEAQDRLLEIFSEQLDELTSLRLTGNKRIWGKIDEGVMELIWWDPEHRICESKKKHT